MFRFKSSWFIFLLTSLVLAFHADAQQAPQNSASEPVPDGNRGFL